MSGNKAEVGSSIACKNSGDCADMARSPSVKTRLGITAAQHSE